MKSYFLPRIISYVIDIFLVVSIVTVVGYAIPGNKNVEALQEDYSNLAEKYTDKKITESEFLAQSITITYDLNYANVPLTIIEIAIFIGYFIVFQFYNKGQTFGKKIMKIKVTSANESELTINNYIYRSLIIHQILLNIILLGILLFTNEKVYYYGSITMKMIQGFIMMSSVIMVLYRKDGRGVHDLLSNTRVVMLEEGEN